MITKALFGSRVSASFIPGVLGGIKSPVEFYPRVTISMWRQLHVQPNLRCLIQLHDVWSLFRPCSDDSETSPANEKLFAVAQQNLRTE
jgi:hypothetical protein